MKIKAVRACLVRFDGVQTRVEPGQAVEVPHAVGLALIGNGKAIAYVEPPPADEADEAPPPARGRPRKG